MNENERTRTEREQYIENNHNLQIEGDPGTEQSVIISKTEQESHVPEQAVPEQENPVNEQSVIISKTEKEPESEPIITPTIPEEEQEPQEDPVESATVVQDVSHCVTKTDIDN